MKVLLTMASSESFKESEMYETLEQCVDELLALYKTELIISRIPDYYPEWLKDHKYIIKIDDR